MRPRESSEGVVMKNANDAYRAGQERIARQIRQLEALLRAHAERQAREPSNPGFTIALKVQSEALNNLIAMFGGAPEEIR
jgi:hypothetical protein